MGTYSKVTPQLNNTACQASQTCLNINLILRLILEQLSDPELLVLSRVNKKWNYEARCVLRDRGTLTATIGSRHPTCQDLVNLAWHLETMGVVPFSGIHVLFSHHQACQSRLNGRLHPAHEIILEKLPWKIFSVEFRTSWKEFRGCPALTFVKKVLQDFSGFFEELSISLNWEEAESVKQLFLNGSFTRLKTLRLDAHGTDDAFTRFVRALMSCAPNLKELQIVRNIGCFYGHFVDVTSAVVVCRQDFRPYFERVYESLVGDLRRELTDTYYLLNRRAPPDTRKRRRPPLVLQASLASLKTMRMDLLFAIPLMCYRVRLENVTTLEIRLDINSVDGLESPEILELLEGFDFTRVFPKLNQIEIECYSWSTIVPGQISSFVKEGSEVLREHLLDRAAYTKSLTLRGVVSGYTVAFLAQIFPEVKRLSVELGDSTCERPFGFLWVHFINLEELTVISTSWPNWTKNLDSVFCGIFPEEAAQLREKDEEYLKAVNIVPVMPSIAHLQGLRIFTFRYAPTESYSPRGTDPNFVFSKVTGLIGFARCPGLAVTFQTASHQCAEALSHMMPYDLSHESILNLWHETVGGFTDSPKYEACHLP